MRVPAKFPALLPVYIFDLLDGGFHYINTKYKGAVINKVFDSGKARLDLTQGM